MEYISREMFEKCSKNMILFLKCMHRGIVWYPFRYWLWGEYGIYPPSPGSYGTKMMPVLRRLILSKSDASPDLKNRFRGILRGIEASSLSWYDPEQYRPWSSQSSESLRKDCSIEFSALMYDILGIFLPVARGFSALRYLFWAELNWWRVYSIPAPLPRRYFQY